MVSWTVFVCVAKKCQRKLIRLRVFFSPSATHENEFQAFRHLLFTREKKLQHVDKTMASQTHTHTLSLSHTHIHSLSLSHTHTQTHTQYSLSLSLSISLSHTLKRNRGAHTLSLSLTHTHTQNTETLTCKKFNKSWLKAARLLSKEIFFFCTPFQKFNWIAHLCYNFFIERWTGCQSYKRNSIF